MSVSADRNPGDKLTVNNQNARALNDSRRSDCEQASFAVGWLLDHVHPRVAQSLVDGDLLLDLVVLGICKLVVGVARIRVQFEEDLFGFIDAPLHDQPTRLVTPLELAPT